MSRLNNLFAEINNAKNQQAEQLKNFDAQAHSSSDAPASSPQSSPNESSDSPAPPESTAEQSELNERTVPPNGHPERSGHSPARHQKAENIDHINRLNPGTSEKSVMAELVAGPAFETKRLTERYSFEIYTDQIHKINKLKYLYYERFSKHLSKSRIIRDALDEMLDKAFEALDATAEPK